MQRSTEHCIEKVDLRLVQPYVPICILVVEMFLISALVLFSSLNEIESWTLAAIIVWFLQRVVVENVIKYNSLLQTVTLASILTHYRTLQEIQTYTEKIITSLWVLSFFTINMLLGIRNYSTQMSKNGKQVICMWAFLLCLMLYSVYTPMHDNMLAFDIVKAFLFLGASIGWTYLFDNKALRNDKVYDFELCQLKFLPMLFTNLFVSTFMFLGYAFCMCYVKVYDVSKISDEATENATNAEYALANINVENSHDEEREFFRLALQKKEDESKIL